MKSKKADDGTVTVWISRRETRDWADRPNCKWLCSTVAGHPVRAVVSPGGDIVDAVIGGRPADQADQQELKYIVLDFLGGKHEQD